MLAPWEPYYIAERDNSILGYGQDYGEGCSHSLHHWPLEGMQFSNSIKKRAYYCWRECKRWSERGIEWENTRYHQEFNELWYLMMISDMWVSCFPRILVLSLQLLLRSIKMTCWFSCMSKNSCHFSAAASEPYHKSMVAGMGIFCSSTNFSVADIPEIR